MVKSIISGQHAGPTYANPSGIASALFATADATRARRDESISSGQVRNLDWINYHDLFSRVAGAIQPQDD